MDSNKRLVAELKALAEFATSDLQTVSATQMAKLLRTGGEHIRPRARNWADADYEADGKLVSALLNNLPVILTALTQQPADHIPDASNMVPAEQIADGALGVTQRDRAIAWDMRDADNYPESYFDSWMAGVYDDVVEVKAFARHAQQARAQALEEAAMAARDALVDMDWPPDDGDEQVDAVMEAIRALQPHGQGGGE